MGNSNGCADLAYALLRARQRVTESGEGGRCYDCRLRYVAGAPIYGDYAGDYFVTYCASCAPKRGRIESTCKTCARTVCWPYDYSRLGRGFCSDNCKRQYPAMVQRDRRIALREKVCADCRNEFTASRVDAKYCSRACRQRAYRRRGSRTHKISLRLPRP